MPPDPITEETQQTGGGAGASTGTTTASTGKPTLRVNPPPPFDQHTKGYPARQFIFLWENYRKIHSAVPDTTAIALVGTTLTGAAAAWFQFCAREEDFYEQSWDEFTDAFMQEFTPHEEILLLRKQLSLLKQKGSVYEYVRRFREIAPWIADMDESEKFHRFMEGLDPRVAAQVRMARINSLEGAMRAAQDAYPFIVEQHRAFTEAHTGRRSFPHAGARSSPSPSGDHGPAPMELGATAPAQRSTPTPTKAEEDRLTALRDNKSGAYPKLTAEDRQLLTKLGACFYCRQLGHMSPACPIKPVRANRPQQGK